MTDIFIKSFNRPYYLDRCLQGIKTYVSGNFQVTILDDGTPEKYLNKIREKYPHVKIRISENYSQKIKAIQENLEHGKDINGFHIPTDLWRNAAENASEYFIMTEDDVWFTEKINVNELAHQAKENKVALLKLGWLGNFKDDQWVDLLKINENLVATQPKDLFLSHPFIMDLFFYNKYKFFTLGYRLKMFDNETKLRYWALNSILMGFWNKDYWNFVWKDAQGKVDEKQQLRNAAIYYRKHKNNPHFIARLNKEAMRTTFQSSATNSYHEYGFDFDVNMFNHLISEAWYKDNFDVMQNFPKDFSTDYWELFIEHKINTAEFRKWVERFKNQYRNLGCEIE
ncbi:hypothetical protein HMPREF9699_00500 [Bergeyella zoohelcum ATCC 43767]|uniref:Uncharacterized protein n=1 Tax=Bergeyella zoohelcum ATCC 43767 TaxID=883096 RepID=K1MRV7_9FLAO|nr:hypothetical protein HMPREF9699_00500 [Bergeyella zoohelcum ATCC 43767]SUV49311.1 Uncharacterised protein [Bergeyella zoohelcum]